MLNNEQIDLLYRVFTNQLSFMDKVFLSETVRDGTVEEEFIHLLIRRIVKPVDFQEEMFKVISENITKEALTDIVKDFFKDPRAVSGFTDNVSKVGIFIDDIVIYTFKEYFNVDVNERRRLSDGLGFYNYGKICRFIQTYPNFRDMDNDTLNWRGFTFTFDCNNIDFETFINYEEVIRSIATIVKYVDLDRLPSIPKKSSLTVRQVLKLGVTHKNLRELNQDFFEGFSEREFNDYVNYHLDEIHYSVITKNRVRLKEFLIDKLRGRLEYV